MKIRKYVKKVLCIFYHHKHWNGYFIAENKQYGFEMLFCLEIKIVYSCKSKFMTLIILEPKKKTLASAHVFLFWISINNDCLLYSDIWCLSKVHVTLFWIFIYHTYLYICTWYALFYLDIDNVHFSSYDPEKSFTQKKC